MKSITPSGAAFMGLAWVVLPGLLLFAIPLLASVYSIENLQIDWTIYLESQSTFFKKPNQWH